jgi:hypothetical protein
MPLLKPKLEGRMTEEIFDVVNDRDEVIGCETRSEVHRLGLQHRSVHVLIFNQRGQIFLQKRSMKKGSAAGFVGFFCFRPPGSRRELRRLRGA